MKGVKKLRFLLETLAGPEQYLYSPSDFRLVFPELSDPAMRMLLARAVADGVLASVCRGIYLYDKVPHLKGLVLYHTAAKLRADTFNYLSLESALSDAGVISQIPIQWISIMSGGRSGKVACGKWGTIEFVHSARKPEKLIGDVIYDERCRLWRATVRLALRDMRACRRPMDLIDWTEVNESL